MENAVDKIMESQYKERTMRLMRPDDPNERMKMWRRLTFGGESTTLRLSWCNVTEVYENGDYYMRREWSDGVVTGEFRTNVRKMGWPSVREFLANKSGFVPVIERT